VTVFPGEVYKPPKQWAERAYRKLVYYHRADKGGHFAGTAAGASLGLG